MKWKKGFKKKFDKVGSIVQTNLQKKHGIDITWGSSPTWEKKYVWDRVYKDGWNPYDPKHTKFGVQLMALVNSDGVDKENALNAWHYNIDPRPSVVEASEGAKTESDDSSIVSAPMTFSASMLPNIKSDDASTSDEESKKEESKKVAEESTSTKTPAESLVEMNDNDDSITKNSDISISGDKNKTKMTVVVQNYFTRFQKAIPDLEPVLDAEYESLEDLMTAIRGTKIPGIEKLINGLITSEMKFLGKHLADGPEGIMSVIGTEYEDLPSLYDAVDALGDDGFTGKFIDDIQ